MDQHDDLDSEPEATSPITGGKDALNLLRAIVMLPAVGKAFIK